MAAKYSEAAKEYRIATTARLLAEGAHVNAADDTRLPLHFAAQDDGEEVVRMLLDAGADVNVATSAAL